MFFFSSKKNDKDDFEVIEPQFESAAQNMQDMWDEPNPSLFLGFILASQKKLKLYLLIQQNLRKISLLNS